MALLPAPKAWDTLCRATPKAAADTDWSASPEPISFLMASVET